MKTVFFLALVFLITDCSAQSLKDSLFSGKLKVDSNLIKKSKINEQKPAPDSAKKVAAAAVNKIPADSLTGTGADTLTIANSVNTDSAQVQATAVNPPLRYEDNNKVWKKFTDEYTAIINKEVLPSKKIKRGTYSIFIEYEIGTDGVVTTKNVTCTPENKYLVEQINERMMPNAPQLAPMIRDGVPRKSSRRQVINFTKEKN